MGSLAPLHDRARQTVEKALIAPPVYGEIAGHLARLEKEHDVMVLLAVESGSRAWGFASVNSDYDVRFVYARERNAYLSVFPKRDVIEGPLDERMDINGWDIRKAVALLAKANPSLQEWLTSPIIYRAHDAIAPLADLASQVFDPQASVHHYLSSAQASLDRSASDRVRAKTYLYSLRPLLCARWVLAKNEQPPILFQDLLSLLPTGIRSEVDRLLAAKARAQEKDTVPRSAVVDRFLTEEIADLKQKTGAKPKAVNHALFDTAFLAALARLPR